MMYISIARDSKVLFFHCQLYILMAVDRYICIRPVPSCPDPHLSKAMMARMPNMASLAASILTLITLQPVSTQAVT